MPWATTRSGSSRFRISLVLGKGRFVDLSGRSDGAASTASLSRRRWGVNAAVRVSQNAGEPAGPLFCT